MSDNDLYSQFTLITGVTDDADITNYLAEADFQLQPAIDLYFSTTMGPFVSSKISSGQSHVRDEDLHNLDGYNDCVRKPDEVKRARLLDDSELAQFEYLDKSKTSKVMSAFGSGAHGAGKKLANLFRPPTDIMCPLSFEEMIDRAQEDNKWVMINIQSESEFQSHQLNRDVWSDDVVKDMILCSFYFWQKLDFGMDGQQFITRYKVTSLPHISVINPITGALVWKLEGDIVPSQLLEKLQDFLGNYSVPSQWNNLKQMSLTRKNVEADERNVKIPDTGKDEASKLHNQPSNTSLSPIDIQTESINIEGFNITEIKTLASTAGDTIGGNATATVKVKLPSTSFVLQLPEESPIIHLLSKVSERLSSGETRFDVLYGFPQVKLSDKVATTELLLKSLKDVNILGNSVITVRLLK